MELSFIFLFFFVHELIFETFFFFFFFRQSISAGVTLERGYVADEDTTIYNPGLSLLTESEKNSLVNAIIENRKGNIASNSWSQDNEYAFDFLKTRLDPLHMYELKGYLKFYRKLLRTFGIGSVLRLLYIERLRTDYVLRLF